MLFLQDTDGDDVADTREVVVTGFGRDDTHELPNSLTWGPDGYLYGLNGVFNFSHVNQDGKNFDFTCAMFRIEPRSRKFELFVQGTSNPWGIAFDDRGEAFVSACVIDHLWHLSEGGYYQRQAGAYPPHTWIMDSIVQHKHFKAAYCGVHYFDSPAFPDAYRGQLYMGNIHGGSINSDSITPAGASYTSEGNSDLLRANDVWFMPVAQKTAPDGSMYLLDWYDRYHCYQDANRDPSGIDRLKGRLYRIRYGERVAMEPFDLQQESDQQLIQRLADPNVYYRDRAQHILAYRLQESSNPDTQKQLINQALNAADPLQRRTAMWTLVSSRACDLDSWKKLAQASDSVVRTFAWRMAGNMATDRDPKIAEQWRQSISQDLQKQKPDTDLQVRLAVIVAARKILGEAAVETILKQGGDFPADATGSPQVLAQLTWQNLLPVIQRNLEASAAMATSPSLQHHAAASALSPRLAEILLQQKQWTTLAALISKLAGGNNGEALTGPVLDSLWQRIQTGEVDLEQLKESASLFSQLSSDSLPLLAIQAALGQSTAIPTIRERFLEESESARSRTQAFQILCFLHRRTPSLTDPATDAAWVLKEPETDSQLAAGIVDALLQLRSDSVAELLLRSYAHLEPATRSRVIESLTSRPDWAEQLFVALGDPQNGIPASAINETQVRRLMDLQRPQLQKLIQKNWGTLDMESRGLKIDEMIRVRRIFRDHAGDSEQGWIVYDRVCGQCHQFGDRGARVGPALDGNGRASLTQLLSNMVDPNLVIGKDYQARLVATVDGRVFSGLVVEESEQRLVLNTQGGKLVTLPVEDIEQQKTSEISLMPEGQTQQMSNQEIADLMQLLIQMNPQDPSLGVLPEANVADRSQWNPERYDEILGEVFADFHTHQGFENGLGLLSEYRGRKAIVRTHPESRQTPTTLTRTVQLPEQTAMKLKVGISHHAQGDWQFRAKVNGKELVNDSIGLETTKDGWRDLEIDLSEFAGQEVVIELENAASDWAYEFGYWSHAYLVPLE